LDIRETRLEGRRRRRKKKELIFTFLTKQRRQKYMMYIQHNTVGKPNTTMRLGITLKNKKGESRQTCFFLSVFAETLCLLYLNKMTKMGGGKVLLVCWEFGRELAHALWHARTPPWQTQIQSSFFFAQRETIINCHTTTLTR
jgi:hypothetical protein